MGHDVLPAVGGENGLVGPRRSVERDLLLDQALVRCQLRVGVADHDKRRCRVREISAFASGLAHALFCPRKNTLAEIFWAVERVDVQTFADLPGHAAHVLVYARDVDWDPWMLDRPGIEHRCHEVEAVELAVEVEPGAGLPAVPDVPDRQHLLAKLRARRLELHRETPLVVPFTCEPSPRIIRPPDAFWRSHAMYAVIIGLRGNATAMAVPRLIRSGVVAATASGRYGSCCVSEDHRQS